eukprot:363429-Chlamydomonas_euryale.AAC.23
MAAATEPEFRRASVQRQRIGPMQGLEPSAGKAARRQRLFKCGKRLRGRKVAHEGAVRAVRVIQACAHARRRRGHRRCAGGNGSTPVHVHA